MVCALVVLINERYYTKFQMMIVSIVLLYSFSSIGVLDGSDLGLVMETIRIVVVPFLLNMNVTEEQWISIFKKPCVGCVVLWGVVLFLGKGKMDKIRTE